MQLSKLNPALYMNEHSKTLTVCADTTHKFAMRTTGFCGLLSKTRRSGILASRLGLVDCIILINCKKTGQTLVLKLSLVHNYIRIRFRVNNTLLSISSMISIWRGRSFHMTACDHFSRASGRTVWFV